jgi:hypothetical protein
MKVDLTEHQKMIRVADALRRLKIDVDTMLKVAEPGFRNVIGSMNVETLKLRIREADEALLDIAQP